MGRRSVLDYEIEWKDSNTPWPTRSPQVYLASDPSGGVQILRDAFESRPLDGHSGLVGWSNVDMRAVMEHVLGPTDEFAKRYAGMSEEEKAQFDFPGVHELVRMWAQDLLKEVQ